MIGPWIGDCLRRDLRQAICDLRKFEVATLPAVAVEWTGREVVAVQLFPEWGEEGEPGAVAEEVVEGDVDGGEM